MSAALIVAPILGTLCSYVPPRHERLGQYSLEPYPVGYAVEAPVTPGSVAFYAIAVTALVVGLLYLVYLLAEFIRKGRGRG